MDALMHMTDDDLKALLIPMVKFIISCHVFFFFPPCLILACLALAQSIHE